MTSIRFNPLGVSAAVLLCPLAAALAQEEVKPSPAATTEAAATEEEVQRRSHEEEIVVTGSRIRRKDLTTPAPITILNRESITASGKASLADFLQSLPEQGNAINTSFNNGGNGATRVSLRGLGSERTLVLLNGRRFVPGGNGANSSVDLNSIPSAAVERVEVLKDGASAVYGSDAIAGVVNIITRRRMNGTEMNGFASTTTAGDGTTYDLNVTTGTSGERGSLLFAGGFFKANSVMAGDRDFSKIPIAYDATGKTSGLKPGVYSAGSGTIPEGRLVLGSKAVGKKIDNPTNDPRINLYNQLVTRDPTSNAFIPDATDPLGWRAYKGPSLKADGGDGYNFQPENYLVTPSQRVQIFTLGEAKLGRFASAFFEGTYTNRRSDQRLAPEPLLTSSERVTVSAQNVYNPFGVDVTDIRRRLLEFGPRTYAQDIDTFRAVAGLEGQLPEEAGPLKGWNWDTSLNYGRTQGTQLKSGNLLRHNLQTAIGPSFYDAAGVARCGTKAAPIAGCVPLNLFGGYTPAAPSITPDQTTNLTFTGALRGTNELLAAQANATGELFRLLAERPVGLALGYEYRMVQGENIPDPITVAGDTTGNKGDITRGRYHVNEGYAELSVPIVDRLDFAQVLEATAAVRVFSYNNFGSDATYKFGGRWQIVRDVTLRGTYSTAFRAPSISDLYQGQSDSFPGLKDPCRGTAVGGPPPPASCGSAANNGDDQSQLRTRIGGNPGLKAETAKTFTAGIVLEPRWVRDLTITLDYFNIAVDQAIARITGAVILGNCYPTDPAAQIPGYCSTVIQRDQATGRILNIIDTNNNVGGDKTSGIDIAVQYKVPTQVGRFSFGFDGSWLAQYDRTLADGTLIKGRGTYDIGVYPSFKFLAGLGWVMGPVSAGVITHFTGKFTECGDANGDFSGSGLCYKSSTYSRLVSSYNSYDLYAGYSFQSPVGKTVLAAGVNNVFNKNPSVIYNGFLAASDPSAYDFIGRYVYFRAGHTF